MRDRPPFEVVSIDGKAARRGRDRGGRTPYIVNAWADAHGIVLGEVRVDEKSNEITAIPRLLETLGLAGCIVTLDAAGCQKAIMGQIVRDCGADCVLALKDNQRTMHEEMRLLFERELTASPQLFARSETVMEKNSGRIERRTCWQTDRIGWFEDLGKWPGLRSVIMVEAERTARDPETGEFPKCENVEVCKRSVCNGQLQHQFCGTVTGSTDTGIDHCPLSACTLSHLHTRKTAPKGRRIALCAANRWRRCHGCGMRDAMLAASQSLEARDAMLSLSD